jgi:predicted nucleic acid-binding protein
MTAFTFDTSFIIARKLSVYPDNFFYSDVVLLELIGSAKDEAEFKRHQAARRENLLDDRLIVPNEEDWLMASKILYWLEQGKRRGNKGMAPPKRPGATQRMALDALIAMSARRYDVTVVTENYDDFNAIKYYRDFKLMRGSEFLDRFG